MNLDDSMQVEKWSGAEPVSPAQKPKAKQDKSVKVEQQVLSQQPAQEHPTTKRKHEVEKMDQDKVAEADARTLASRPLIKVVRRSAQAAKIVPQPVPQQPSPTAPTETGEKSLKRLKRDRQTVLDEYQEKINQLQDPKNPLHKFLTLDFPGLNARARLDTDEVERVITELREAETEATALLKQEIEFADQVTKEVYGGDDQTIKEALSMRSSNAEKVLSRLKKAYADLAQKVPPGLSFRISELEAQKKFIEALHLFELAVAVTKNEEIRKSFEVRGKKALLKIYSDEKSSSEETKEFVVRKIREALYTVGALPLHLVFAGSNRDEFREEWAGVVDSSLREKKARPTSKYISRGEDALLEDFFAYCAQNIALNKRLKNQSTRNAAEQYLYNFSYKTHLLAGPGFAQSLQKIHNILGIKQVKASLQDHAAVSEKMALIKEIYNVIEAKYKEIDPKNLMKSQFRDLFDRLRFLNPYCVESFQRWRTNVERDLNQKEQSLIKENFEEIMILCDEVIPIVEKIRKNLQTVTLKPEEQLLPGELHQLLSYADFARDLRDDIGIPDTYRLIGTRFDQYDSKMNAFLRIIYPREVGNLLLQSIAKDREFRGKAPFAWRDYVVNFKEASIIEAFITQGHAGLTTVEHNGMRGTTSIEMFWAGVQKLDNSVVHLFVNDEFRLDFSKIIIPERLPALRKLLGVENDEEVFAEIQALYQQEFFHLLEEKSFLINNLKYGSQFSVAWRALLNFFDEATMGKIIPRFNVEKRYLDSMQQLARPEGMVCSEFTSVLMNRTLLAVETNLNERAHEWPSKPYFSETLPVLINGTTPDRLYTFAKQFCQLKPRELAEKFFRIPKST